MTRTAEPSGQDRGDEWAQLGRRFVGSYDSLRGRVRTHVIHEHLLTHLGEPPLRIVDVGGGAGNQSIPLARLGHEVTILDPSPAMLERAAIALAAERAEVRRNVDLVEATGADAPTALGGEMFGAVLCHGVLMYLPDPAPLLDALCGLAGPGGLVSIVATNAAAMAARPAQDRDWEAALAAFTTNRQVNRLGVETRGDRVEDLTAALAERGVDPIAWYGVRLFTDGWARDSTPSDPEEPVLAVELEASRRDPYRQLSRMFHLVGRRQA